MTRKSENIFLALIAVTSLILLPLCISCKGKVEAADDQMESEVCPELTEDTVAERRLQGIWINAETQHVVFKVKGDSIYYPDVVNLPMQFRIYGDSLHLCGEEVQRYKIVNQGDYTFEIVSPTGEAVCLHKSDNPEDSLAFLLVHTAPVIYSEVTKRDTVVVYDNSRYHCYVFVNPSRNKVYKNGYNEEGFSVKNFYYDNIIHLSVFEGKRAILSRDFNKMDFKDIVPENFLQQATLSDVVFSHVDAAGFHFDATICIPDDAVCYMVQVLVQKDGRYELNLMDY